MSLKFTLPEFSPEQDYIFLPTDPDTGIIFALKEFPNHYAILNDFIMKDADDGTGEGILDFEMKFTEDMPDEVQESFRERVGDCLVKMLTDAVADLEKVQE